MGSGSGRSGSNRADRPERGSWLDGPGGAAASRAAQTYPGERLGLPESGPTSVASFGRRVAAICIDWACCLLIVSLITGRRPLTPGHSSQLTLLIFGLEYLVLLTAIGATLGMRLCGIGVRRLDGTGLPLPWVAVRTLLLLLVIPAVVYDADHRGLHDKAANSVVVRLQRGG